MLSRCRFAPNYICLSVKLEEKLVSLSYLEQNEDMQDQLNDEGNDQGAACERQDEDASCQLAAHDVHRAGGQISIQGDALLDEKHWTGTGE